MGCECETLNVQLNPGDVLLQPHPVIGFCPPAVEALSSAIALILSGGFDLPLTSCAAARFYHLALGELTPMVNFLACLLGRATAFFRFLHLRCIGVDGHLRLLPSLAFTPSSSAGKPSLHALYLYQYFYSRTFPGSGHLLGSASLAL